MTTKKKSSKDDLKVRGVRLSDKQWNSLTELARKDDRDNSYLIRQAIDEYLAKRLKPQE